MIARSEPNMIMTMVKLFIINSQGVSAMKRFAVALVVCFIGAGVVRAQGQDWMTSNGDAQRTAWVRSDAKISKETVKSPDFQFLWKLKLKNEPRQLNSLMPPATLERLIGYRGFRMLGFVGGSSDNVFTIDTDLGRMEWEKRFTSTAPAVTGTMTCPGGMTNGVARPTIGTIPAMVAGGRGRSNPAKSAVGKPGEGAVTLAMVPPPRPAAPPPSTPPPVPARPNPASPPGGQFGRGPFLVYALSSDGMLRSMHLSNGADYEPPVKFIPPNANSNGLIVTDNVAYVVTEGNCGGAANGLWALDLITKKVTSWKANVSGSAGPAFDGKGTIYVTTGSGGEIPNSLIALDQKTLMVKGWYSAGDRQFSSTPVIFNYREKTLIAAATRDGRIHLLEGGNPGGSDHRTALFVTSGSVKSDDFAPGALTSWQDAGGTQWVLSSTTGTQAVDAGFPETNGKISNGSIVAWKVVDQNGSPELIKAWASRDLISPLTPTIINGVAFVVSSGEFRTSDARMTAAERARRSKPAVIYALDAATGRELWNSGSMITSFAHGGAISGGMGQIYLGTHDGTLYAFGFPMEH